MRPEFHFTAATGWINDPHGITYRDGHYEVFYQYVPESLVWAPNCHWGHARGVDLLSLSELPVAITPGDGDGGIWTGCLVNNDEGATSIFYTATALPDLGMGRIRVATPKDDTWMEWQKGAVVADAPPDLDIVAFRDPFIRREGSAQRMFVGAGTGDGTAMALTYISRDDMKSWEYDGVALSRSTDETEPVWMGALWECPQIFPIGDRWVMVSSIWDADNLHYAAYALGRYADGTFEADTWRRLTYGASYYAPSLFYDSQGQPCLSFWMRGIADQEAGWASAHSLPHLLSIENDTLIATPHPDVARYRHPYSAEDSGDGDALDLEWKPTLGDRLDLLRGEEVIASLRQEPDGLSIDVQGVACPLPGSSEVRIVIDGPVLELSSKAGNFGAAIGFSSSPLRVRAAGTTPEIYRMARRVVTVAVEHAG